MFDGGTSVWQMMNWNRRHMEGQLSDLERLVADFGEFATREAYPGIPRITSSMIEDTQTTGDWPHQKTVVYTKLGAFERVPYSDKRIKHLQNRYKICPLYLPLQPKGWQLSIPEFVTATLDLQTQVVTAWTKDGVELGDAMYNPAMDASEPSRMASYVNSAFALAGIAGIADELVITGHENYPWKVADRVVGYGYIANDQVRVPLVGAAVDDDDRSLIFAWFAGHDANVRSIMATLNSGGNKATTLFTHHGQHTAKSTGQYYRWTLPVGERLVSAFFLDTRCADAYVDGKAYLIQFKEDWKANPAQAFLSRLQSVEPTPLASQWADVVFKEAKNHKLTKHIVALGAVSSAMVITANEAWRKLVGQLLEYGRISIPEEG